MSHRGQLPNWDHFHIGHTYTRATFLDVLFGFLYLYIPAMSKEERHDEEGHTPPQRVENKTKTQQGGGMPLSAMSKEE